MAPGSLEEYLKWNYGETTPEMIEAFEPYRIQIEKWLDGFDEDSHSWRDYAFSSPVNEDDIWPSDLTVDFEEGVTKLELGFDNVAYHEVINLKNSGIDWSVIADDIHNLYIIESEEDMLNLPIKRGDVVRRNDLFTPGEGYRHFSNHTNQNKSMEDWHMVTVENFKLGDGNAATSITERSDPSANLNNSVNCDTINVSSGISESVISHAGTSIDNQELTYILDNVVISSDIVAPVFDVARAKDVLSKAMKDDPDLAWSWHCNTASSFRDSFPEGSAIALHADVDSIITLDINKICNEAACRFMKLVFDVDTSPQCLEQFGYKFDISSNA